MNKINNLHGDVQTDCVKQQGASLSETTTRAPKAQKGTKGQNGFTAEAEVENIITAEDEVENINTAEAVETKEREEFPKTEDDNNPLNDKWMSNWINQMLSINDWILNKPGHFRFFLNNPQNQKWFKWNWLIRMGQITKLFSQKDSKRNLYMWPGIAEHIDICGIYSSDGVNFYFVGKDQATNLYYTWSVYETEDPMDILSKDAWSEVRIFKVEGETSIPAKALNTVGRLVKMEEK